MILARSPTRIVCSSSFGDGGFGSTPTTPAESLAIIRSEPLRFRKGRRPRGLKALIRALLAVDPAARPARAADVAESLRALVAELE